MTKREIDRRLEEIVEFAEVDKFLDTPVKRYSSGMRVRLAFAVAAHLDPEILIIDEVLSVGDHSFQVKCLDKMRSIAGDEGRTVLYVSHNLVTVENLCRRALLLVGGRLAFDGDTGDTVLAYMRTLPHAERGRTAGVFDLAAADRSSAGHGSMFERLEFRPGGGVPSDTIRMGERLLVQIAVEGLHAVSEATVLLTVGSAANRSLFRMSSRMLPLQAAQPRRTDETIVLNIPSLLLTPGDYHMDVEIYASGGVPVDSVNHAAEFTVLPADVLGTGYQFAARDGHFVVPWTWELRPSTTDDVGSHDSVSASTSSEFGD
jgi:lipopolysaccharide transport system ATP-binding protein